MRVTTKSLVLGILGLFFIFWIFQKVTVKAEGVDISGWIIWIPVALFLIGAVWGGRYAGTGAKWLTGMLFVLATLFTIAMIIFGPKGVEKYFADRYSRDDTLTSFIEDIGKEKQTKTAAGRDRPPTRFVGKRYVLKKGGTLEIEAPLTCSVNNLPNEKQDLVEKEQVNGVLKYVSKLDRDVTVIIWFHPPLPGKSCRESQLKIQALGQFV